jgi:hypothetical protein
MSQLASSVLYSGGLMTDTSRVKQRWKTCMDAVRQKETVRARSSVKNGRNLGRLAKAEMRAECDRTGKPPEQRSPGT